MSIEPNEATAILCAAVLQEVLTEDEQVVKVPKADIVDAGGYAVRIDTVADDEFILLSRVPLDTIREGGR